MAKAINAVITCLKIKEIPLSVKFNELMSKFRNEIIIHARRSRRSVHIHRICWQIHLYVPSHIGDYKDSSLFLCRTLSFLFDGICRNIDTITSSTS